MMDPFYSNEFNDNEPGSPFKGIIIAVISAAAVIAVAWYFLIYK